MRITINAFGSRGDVQPLLALGKGLKEAGQTVRFVTHRIFEDLVREQSVDFVAIELDPRQILINQAVADIGNNPVSFSRWVAANFQPVMEEVFRITLATAQDADMLLNSSLCFAGWHVSEKLGIPSVGVYLQPAIPTRAFHGMAVAPPPTWLPFKGLYNYISAKFTNQTFFNVLRSLVNRSREEVLGLKKLSALDFWQLDAPKTEAPILFGYSPSIVPKPGDWGQFQQVTGYWFLESSPEYEPPAELADFLAAGHPPIYVGFGSMVDHEREAMTALVVEALQQAGQRAILLGGWSELDAARLPDSILRVDNVPHDWLFPRMAAVVHHGGAGTTAAGLRAGVPSVVVPFFADQPFWGWRVHQLGAGPKWIPRQKLTADRLAEAIDRAVHDEAMGRRAAELGTRIRAEDGIGSAVRQIEAWKDLRPVMPWAAKVIPKSAADFPPTLPL